MTIVFYAYDGDPRTVSKIFDPDTALTVSSADVYGTCDLLYPTLIMGYSAELAGKNYFYVSDWSRYYGIRSMTLDSAGRCIVSGAVDVLKTYDADIRSCIGRATRCRDASFVPDPSAPIIPGREYVVSKQFASSDLDGAYAAGTQHFLLALK